MKAAIYATLITLALSSVGAQANPNKNNHGQHQGKKVGHKKHKHHDTNVMYCTNVTGTGGNNVLKMRS